MCVKTQMISTLSELFQVFLNSIILIELNEASPACGSCHRSCLNLTREYTAIFLSQCGHVLCKACLPEYDWRLDRLYKDCPKCSEKIVILTELKKD